MEKVSHSRAAVKPRELRTPTRGDLTELLDAIVRQWDRAANAHEFMKAVTPHIKTARRYIDAADAQRLPLEQSW